MRKIFATLAVAALAAMSSPATASAQPIEAGDANDGQAFAGVPLTDAGLSTIFGAGLQDGRSGSLRLQYEHFVFGSLQQTGQTSRIALDNWWSQTGAALIDENLLASRTAR